MIGLTAEEVERGYNNRAAVPEHPQWFERWAQASREARERYAPKLDLRYGSRPKETLDLFLPAGRPRGTLVFVHGGYWRALDKADHAFVAGPFVEQGIAVVVQNYDLCPQVSIATIVDETQRCLAWVAGEGGRQGAHATNVVVAGHSAGGHLVAMMLATPASGFGLERHPVAGAVSLSGVHDLRPMVLFSFNADFKLDEAEAMRLSPTLLPAATRAPIVAAVGADETSAFLRQTELLWDAWPDNRPTGDGAPLRVAGKHHFSVVFDYADAGSEITRRTLGLF